MSLHESMTNKFLAVLLGAGLCVGIAGCQMKVDKRDNGETKKVDIQTPVGDMKVRTEAKPADVGMAVYPNATLKPKGKDHDGQANVNIDTSFFGLKVSAVSYLSDDTPDKILSYYKDEMSKKFGNVIQCRGGSGDANIHGHNDEDKPVSCGKEHGNSETIELKSGTEHNQHIVAVKPSGKGSEFSLVYVKVRGGKEGEI